MNEEEIFHEALARSDSDERARYLEQACAGNPGLRASVDALLRAAVGATGFLDRPPGAPSATIDEVAPEHNDENRARRSAMDSPQDATAEYDSEDLGFLTPCNNPELLGSLGHYEILEVLGKGGMGTVVRAFDAKLHRVVAIKVMAAQLATHGTARKRFTREAQAQAAVSHDHIVTIHAVESDGQVPYLVMQYISGMSLQQRLDKNGPMQLNEILRIGMQTASGLVAAHAQGLVHRDIKPANILLENGVERVKITDFGLARAATEASLTQSGVVAGTPQFMSPEQAEGKAIDQRTDLFSLGSVLYAMCTGRAPFRASGTMAILKRVCEETPTPIRETNPDIPDWLVAIIDKLHAKDPANRYQTAAEVAELLNQHLAHLQHPSMAPLPVTTPTKARSAWRRRRVMAAVVLLCLAASVIGLTAALIRDFTREPTSGLVNLEAGAFVVLGGKGIGERRFNTLAEAVTQARSNDTIEIRGNGPFLIDSLSLGPKALTIRAGSGHAPVMKPNLAAIKTDVTELWRTGSRLTLEGLELHWQGLPESSQGLYRGVVGSTSGPLFLTNCKLIINQDKTAITYALSASNASGGQVRNCLIVSPGYGILLVNHLNAPGMRWTIENCLIAAHDGVGWHPDDNNSPGTNLKLSRNTLVGGGILTMARASGSRGSFTANPVAPALIETEGNVCQVGRVFGLNSVTHNSPDGLPVEVQRGVIPKLLHWKEHGNVYGLGDHPFLELHPPPTRLLKDLAEWNKFWELKDTGSVQGPVLLRGDPKALLVENPNAIIPDHFRLAEGSAGSKAGKDGQDLGANVDLVGPGEAYERWKKTPEYQQWLKDTKQVTTAEETKAEPMAFVVLGGKGVAERSFETLAEAVAMAIDGDTVEIRGNGPFVTEPLVLKMAMTIRAGAGFRPLITDTPDANDMRPGLLRAEGSLNLEGLEIHSASKTYLILNAQGPLSVANCRFFSPGSPAVCIEMDTAVQIRNCELLAPHGAALAFHCDSEARSTITNCLLVGHTNLQEHDVERAAKLRFTRNTFLSPLHGALLHLMWLPRDKFVPDSTTRLDLFASENVVAAENGMYRFIQPERFTPVLEIAEAEAWLAKRVAWTEEQNVYRPSIPLLGIEIIPLKVETNKAKDLEEWNHFWKLKTTKSSQGVLRFQGGDLTARAKSYPKKLIAEDFRLLPASAGYKAGKDGKDLGADVDLVGPGPAYERWKKTPEYQQWLKETKQVTKTEAPKAQAFVVLRDKGIEARKYDSLAEAVQGASAGDTIEVRGKGPFVTEPIKIRRPLRIRAGEGFRPVIKLSSDGLRAGAPLLESEAALVLEGLELQRMAQERKESPPLEVVLTTSKDLHVANCRFLMRKTPNCIINSSPVSELRNCEFLCADYHAGAMVMLSLLQSGQRLVIDNCLLTDFARVNIQEQSKVKGAAVQLTRNTFRTRIGAFWFYQVLDKAPNPKDLDQRAKVLGIETSGNIFDASFAVQFEQDPPEKRLPTRETAIHLAHTVGWVGERNLYAVDGPFGFVHLDTTFEPTHTPVKNLVDWRRFWATAEADSIEGRVRYQSGDLLAKLAATPEQLTPDDFRLHPDSAGHKAGKDGKDLGADVDLVGPGPAYERWKKTPEYQQWLKDTNEVTNAEAAKPVLRMHFDKTDFYEKDGKTYVRDHSGKGNDGLCEQVQFTPEGKTGGGLANAGKGFLRLPTSLVAGRSDFTIAAWVKRTNLDNPGTVYACLPKDYPTRDLPAFHFYCTNQLSVGAWDPTLEWVHATALNANFSRGEWVFLAVTLENGAPGKGRLQLMLNDRFAERTLQQVGGGPLEEIQDIAALKLEGVFDELAVWHRALTEQELREVFRQHQPASK